MKVFHEKFRNNEFMLERSSGILTCDMRSIGVMTGNNEINYRK